MTEDDFKEYVLSILNDTKTNDTKINDTKTNDTKINDTKTNDTKINDTKINDTKINDTKILQTVPTNTPKTIFEIVNKKPVIDIGDDWDFSGLEKVPTANNTPSQTTTFNIQPSDTNEAPKSSVKIDLSKMPKLFASKEVKSMERIPKTMIFRKTKQQETSFMDDIFGYDDEGDE